MLEATQTASGETVFEKSKQWEGQAVNGKYPLRQHIGGSDHSAVFLSEVRNENSQKIAVKLISADGPNADIQLGRLKLASKLSHPYLLQIVEVGSCQIHDHPLLYVAMEYADETLAQILPQRALTPEEAGELLSTILDTLAYVHSNGFAHGHLNPANILVAGEKIKLASDGLARPGAQASGQPSPFDPPEVSSEGLTAAGDVWSLAVTLAETLTQRPPSWTDRLGSEPTLPDRMAEPFAEIARHCLVRDPRSRWQIAQIQQRLRAASEETREQPRPKAVAVKSGAPQKHTSNWLYAIPLAAMIGIILLLATVFHRTPSQTPKPESAAASTQSAPGSRPRVETAKAPEGTLAPDQVVRQVVPDVPNKALRTISGKLKITVRAHVDQHGNVQRAEFASAGPSRYFANLTMQSAQEWKFTPTKSPKTWLLQFVFTRSGVTVQPRQIA